MVLGMPSYLFLTFLHKFIIRRACGSNLCDFRHDPSDADKTRMQKSVILCLINDDNMLCWVVVNLEVGIADTSLAARLECMQMSGKSQVHVSCLASASLDILSNIDFPLSARADRG